MFTHTTELDSSCHPQPRPTLLLTCKENIMPLSWHMPVSKSPFLYAICVRAQNYSYELLHKHKEFALNFLDIKYHEAFVKSGDFHGNEIEKFALTSLTCKKAQTIETSLIEESYMIYECSVVDIKSYGDHDIFIGKVNLIYNADTPDYNPTLFMGRGRYDTLSGHTVQSTRGSK